MYMPSLRDYQGLNPSQSGSVLELHYFDPSGPILIVMPKIGLEHMCGRTLTEQEAETVISAHEKELFPLIDTACRNRGGFADVRWESGVGYRRLEIYLDEIIASSIHISTSILDMDRTVGFADPQTGQVQLRSVDILSYAGGFP
jgi:hypothetical protein